MSNIANYKRKVKSITKLNENNWYANLCILGIFAPVSKISKPGMMTPRNSALSKSRSSGMDHGKVDTSHVTAKVDTG